MKIISTAVLLIAGFVFVLNAQQKIDGTFSFQTDPAKKYSIYVPSSYDANVPNKLMVGFHPLNTARWDSRSWRDTLTVFAEMNDLILLCPDGGADGRVDDAIDTAFTTFIIDSALIWYNIDPEKIFAMGFSWGGRTTYSYGLYHVDRFAGFLPIGAAVNGTNEVMNVLSNAKDKPYFIVHGSLDNMAVRFWPIRTALDGQGACVADSVLTFVGHTIDFPNRNAILTHAFNWLDTVQCGDVISSIPEFNTHEVSLYPNLVSSGQTIRMHTDRHILLEGKVYEVYNSNGQLVRIASLSNHIETDGLTKGTYWLKFKQDRDIYFGRFVITE